VTPFDFVIEKNAACL